ncbi:MAG: SpoIID/LytB domain-containing protein [Clostridiales bacterium]|nr:SpoIID/LytB domain-containing protein [Clostridiales bacterium]
MKRIGLFLYVLALSVVLCGCVSRKNTGKDTPALPQPQNTAADQTKPDASPKKGAAALVPEKLARDESGVPVLKVYDVKVEKLIEESVEEYVPAVLAGEMAGDWPLEALKAQAILARTFVLQFVTEKTSRYDGADISTDIEEAQAYNADAVNDRIRQAVRETRGIVLNAGGELPYAWFHAHSGGLTARAKEGLDYEKDEPGYTQCVKGMENDEAPPEAASWQAAFTEDEVIAAMKDVGAKIDAVTSAAIGQRGESGRAMTLIISGKEVSAPALRIALGSTKMRSSLLESLRVEDGQLQMKGRGYGHGVGMSQWGAYAMAKAGKTAEEIVSHYFKGVSIDKAWE